MSNMYDSEMTRKIRIDVESQIYHVINRANAKVKIFNSNQDYLLFEKTLIQALNRLHVDIFTYTLMPNHIHLALSPQKDGELSKFMHWLTMTFTQRYHSIHRTTGTGHLFQGRYKSYLVNDDNYLLQLFLYIERNALRANLVKNTEDWRWSSLWIRLNGNKSQKEILASWPIEMPKNYLKIINISQTTDSEKLWIKPAKIGRPFKSRKNKKGS